MTSAPVATTVVSAAPAADASAPTSRLVPPMVLPAACAWGTGTLYTHLDVGALWWWCGAVGALGAALLLLWRLRGTALARGGVGKLGGRGRARGGPRRKRRSLTAVLAASACVVAAVSSAAALDAAARAEARSLLSGGPWEATVRLASAWREVSPGVNGADAVLEYVQGRPAGAPVNVRVYASQDRLGPQRQPVGTRVRWWVSAKEPSHRSRAVLALTVRSDALSVTPAATNPATALRSGPGTLTAALQTPAAFGGHLADGAALVPGMVVGDRSAQSEELTAAMNAAGLSHLTAVSGANVAVYLLAMAALLRRLRVPWLWRWPALLASLAGFVAVVGPEPSVLRASVSGALGAVALWLGRPRAALGLTAGAIVLVLAADLWQADSVGFQLSVAATLGIAVLCAPVAGFLCERWRWPQLLAESVAVSVSASVACTPLLVGLSPQQSLLSVPVNVLAAPAASVVALLGPPLAIVGPIVGEGAWWLSVPCVLPAQAIAALAHGALALGWVVTWPEGSGVVAAALFWGLPLCLLRWGAALARRLADVRDRWHRRGSGAGTWLHQARVSARRQQRRSLRRTAALLVAACVLAAGTGALVGAWWPRTVDSEVSDGALVFCDVGQGDAAALVGNNGTALLIDVGPEDGGVMRCLREHGIRSLCGIVITHLHADHVGALPEVLRRFPGTSVLYGTAGRSRPAAHAGKAQGGEQLACGAWTAKVLAAPQSAEENDASLVVMARSAQAGGLEYLSAGDLEAEAAQAFLARGGVRQALSGAGGVPRILKVSHHGARNGGEALMEAQRPHLALIGVGRGNDYGHPTSDILTSLARRGIAVKRTDLDGDIVVTPQSEAPGRVAVSTGR